MIQNNIVPFLLQLTTPQFVTPYGALDAWLPLVFIALMLSMMLIAVYYITGSLFDNAKIKQTAVRELGQVVGVAIIVAIIIAALPSFNNVVALLIPPTALNGICTSLKSTTNVQVNLLQNGILASPFSSSIAKYTPSYYFCNVVNSYPTESGFSINKASLDLTPFMDYGLSSIYLITANVTNQAANDLNSLYIYTSYLGFLANFEDIARVCAPADCFTGIGTLINIKYSSTTFVGYNMLIRDLDPIDLEGVLLFEVLFIQLMLVMFLLYAWPYLLAAGLVLKASIFGRKLGGLLIAIAIVAVIIFPIVFAVEYSALSGGNLKPIGAPIPSLPQVGGSGSTSLNGMALQQSPLKYTSPYQTTATQYSFNPFLLPNVAEILYHDGCWPMGGSTALTELIIVGAHAGIGVGFIFSLLSVFETGLGFVGHLPSFNFFSDLLPSYATCGQENALKSFYDLLNVYGILGASIFLLAGINIIIGLVAVRDLSQLLGGDTDIAGLGKLV
jgi:hypothetical protein